MRLLILGTGGMARAHAEQFGAIKGVELAGAVDLDEKLLDAFCKKYKIGRSFTSLDEAIGWGKFDAVANVTPDHVHYSTTMALLKAGKHVFCEKPLATDHPKALEMAETAEKAGLVGMVNLTYRNVPEIHKVRELVRSGKIGKVKHVEASYLQSWLVSKAWGDWREESQWLWRLSKSHGSNGTLGDIGIHIVDFVNFGSGAEMANIDCRLQTFHKAEGDRIGVYKLDANDSFVMSVGFDNGALGVVHASRWATGHLNELKLRVYGDKGGIELTHRLDGSELRVCLGRSINKATWRTLKVRPVKTTYELFVKAVRAGKTLEPSFAQAAKVQKVLDLCVVADADGCRHEV